MSKIVPRIGKKTSLNQLKSKLKKLTPQKKPNWKVNPRLLLHPNIPKPLHGVNPRSINGSKWWNAIRKEAYRSTDFHCEACGVHKSQAKHRQWLEAHETYRINYRKGTATFIKVVPLCHLCHMYIHSGRLQMLLDSGLITHQKFVAVITHGDRVLREAGLKRPEPYDGKFAEWSTWRLVYNRKRFPPKYPSESDWKRTMAITTRSLIKDDDIG